MAMGLGLILAASLVAGEQGQELLWVSGEGCPSQAAVLEATRAFLGRPLADYPQTLQVAARVEADVIGFRLLLEISVDGVDERHELRGVDCDRLGRDAALLIASAVDPFAAGPEATSTWVLEERQLLVAPVVVQVPRARREELPEPAKTEPEEPASETQVPEPVPDWRLVAAPEPVRPDRRSRRASKPITGTLAVAGTGFAGLFPQPGGGFALEGGLERGLLRWQLGAGGWFGGRFRVGTGGVGADLWAATGSTGLCVAPGWKRVRLAGCAVVGVGGITATSVGTQSPRTLVRPWAYLGPELRVTWTPRPRLGIFLGVAVLPALARPAWSISDPAGEFRVPPVTGLLQLGLELRGLGNR
ncbi:MAG: hypothetical protein KC457_26725 [Myxococcales bacterium]|nr:hypothetical protein [Myxococcales bacterium]